MNGTVQETEENATGKIVRDALARDAEAEARATESAGEKVKVLPMVLFLLVLAGAAGGEHLFRKPAAVPPSAPADVTPPPAPTSPVYMPLPAPAEEAPPSVTAAAISMALEQTGHVALYILFDTAKTEIKPESLPMIAEIATMMRENPDMRLRIEGHTDSVGTPENNLLLSEGRARAVRDALIVRGIAADRLASVGYGQEKPLADNAAEPGRAKNRRVELVRW